MSIKDDLMARLKVEEGVRYKPYTDTVGKLTIGCGRNLTDKGLSASEVNLLLSNDVDETLEACTKFPFWDALNDVRKSVLADMVFNMGYETVSQFHKMLSAMQNQDWPTTAQQMLESTWAHEVGSRAQVLSKLILEG